MQISAIGPYCLKKKTQESPEIVWVEPYSDLFFQEGKNRSRKKCHLRNSNPPFYFESLKMIPYQSLNKKQHPHTIFSRGYSMSGLRSSHIKKVLDGTLLCKGNLGVKEIKTFNPPFCGYTVTGPFTLESNLI